MDTRNLKRTLAGISLAGLIAGVAGCTTAKNATASETLKNTTESSKIAQYDRNDGASSCSL